jgi:uracil-DNA glycosylase
LPELKELLDPRWREIFKSSLHILDVLESEIDFSLIVPKKELIFKAFECDPAKVSVVIFGQDPYPSENHAMGLAFSVNENISKLPASLRNILIEMKEDVGFFTPQNGDLTYLKEQGVLLLNRGLTLNLKTKKVHPLWYEFTDQVARALAKMGVIGIFWGKSASELAKYFASDKKIVSVHPSPLSAYRGFFGSKPFSRTNALLAAQNKPIIEWKKQ